MRTITVSGYQRVKINNMFYMGSWMVDSKKYVSALFPGISEYHMTEDVIKLRILTEGVYLESSRWPLNALTCILIAERQRNFWDRGREGSGTREAVWNVAVINQRMLEPLKLKEAKKDSSLDLQREGSSADICYLTFDLQNWEREMSPLVCGNLLLQHQETNVHGYLEEVTHKLVYKWQKAPSIKIGGWGHFRHREQPVQRHWGKNKLSFSKNY